MDYHDIITIEPGKRSGKPCIRGMRITVYDILEYLAGGMTEAEILEDFSELTSADIKACLAFAADRYNPGRTPTKKPGFLPNLSVQPSNFVKKPGFWAAYIL